MAELADAWDFDVTPFHINEIGYDFSQRVPKGKPLEQKLAKTAKADTERRAKFWNTF